MAIDNMLVEGESHGRCKVAITCFTEIAKVAQRKMPYFRFLRIRSNVSVFVL